MAADRLQHTEAALDGAGDRVAATAPFGRSLYRRSLYIGPSTCLLPVALADEQALVTVAGGITTAGGGIDIFRIEAFDPETERMLVARFSAERDAEYAEVIEQADALIAELDREAKRGKFGFAEVEENDADLAKLRRWLEAIAERDHCGASGCADAQKAVAHADQTLQAFAERSANSEHADGAEDIGESR